MKFGPIIRRYQLSPIPFSLIQPLPDAKLASHANGRIENDKSEKSIDFRL
jgi:hypothetical protein